MYIYVYSYVSMYIALCIYIYICICIYIYTYIYMYIMKIVGILPWFSRSKIETTKHFFLSNSKPISDLHDLIVLTCVVQTNKIMKNIYFSHIFILTIFRFSVWIQDSFYVLSDNLISVFWKKNQSIYFIKNTNAWKILAQLEFTCSKLTIETLRQDVKYVQS